MDWLESSLTHKLPSSTARVPTRKHVKGCLRLCLAWRWASRRVFSVKINLGFLKREVIRPSIRKSTISRIIQQKLNFARWMRSSKLFTEERGTMLLAIYLATWMAWNLGIVILQKASCFLKYIFPKTKHNSFSVVSFGILWFTVYTRV